MSIILTIIIALHMSTPASAAMNPECIQVQKTTYAQCSEIEGYSQSKNAVSDCGTSDSNRHCCCPATTFSETKPKYLLIAGVVGFFAILTTVILFYKKNE